jgi:hypothetical protein
MASGVAFYTGSRCSGPGQRAVSVDNTFAGPLSSRPLGGSIGRLDASALSRRATKGPSQLCEPRAS